MLPAFATVDDLEARDVDVSDAVRAQAALDDSSTLIRVVAGTSWVSDDAVDWGDLADYHQDNIIRICIEAAKRSLDNPDRLVSETQSVGDASHAKTYAATSSDVYLTAAEKKQIRQAAGHTGALGYVDLEIGTPGWSGDVITVVGSDEPLPFTYEPLRP